MKDLLLVGAGHAHLHVLRRARELARAGYRVQLVAPRHFDYSGVASATAVGTFARDVGRIDVRSLAGACGVEFHAGTLEAVDADLRLVTTSAGTRVTYDVLSLNIGSVVAPAGMTVHPSVLRVKPLRGLAELDERLRSASGSGVGATVTVVGGGASGLELSAHLAVRSDVARVQLLESGPHIGAGLPSGARRRITRILADRGVEVRTGCVVRDVGERRVRCDGAEVLHDVALLATGLRAPPVLAEFGLGGPAGVPVGSTLQHAEREEVYAVGDCAHFLPRPLPRIGVHGVRQGPVLFDSLMARPGGQRLPVYRPPRRALSILDLGDGMGLAVRGRWWWSGAGALRLKRLIDRRWLGEYQEG